MNTYHFILEIEHCDLKEMKRVFKGQGKIRKTNLLQNKYYSEEFECWCGIKVYQLKTDLNLDDVKKILQTGSDLHYAYNSIHLIP
jgi:hypothetical protein